MHPARHHVYSAQGVLAGTYLKKLHKVLMYGRDYDAIVNGEPTTKNMPAVYCRDVDIYFDGAAQEVYETLFEHHRKKLMIVENGQLYYNPAKFRQLMLNAF